MHKILKNNVIFGVFSLFIIAIFLLPLIFNVSILNAKTSQISSQNFSENITVQNGAFNISIVSRNGNNISLGSSSPFYNGQAFSARWADANNFSIIYTDSSQSSAGSYNISITVNYLQAYLSNNSFSGRISLENAFSATVNPSSQTEPIEFVIDLDDGISGVFENRNVAIRGWGIYQFVLNVNGIARSSSYYFIEPLSTLNSLPEVVHEKIPPRGSEMHSQFSFSLENYDEYQYIDEACLTWYVKGQASNGTMYALCSSDLSLDNFSDCTVALYNDNYQRTGLNFVFNDKELGGEWQVWCVYRPVNSSFSLTSNIDNIVTGPTFNYLTIIYIVLGIAVVAIAVIITLSIIRIKKEKVW